MDDLKTKGLVIVNTGNGKGKTTAALGLLLRASGWQKRTCMIQFIKNQGAAWGEIRMADRLGLEIIPCGDGFTWQSKDLEQSAALARSAWQEAQRRILGGGYDLIVLDEFTYVLTLGWLETGEVLAWLHANKPSSLHLVITGRDAPPALIEYADIVTEMREIKHPYQAGLHAQKGIEY